MPDRPDLPSELTSRIAFLLQLAVTRAQGMGEQALGGLELHGREYGILALLQHGTLSAQHELGATLGIDRTTTMKLLAGLEARGLVRRERAEHNRRAYRVELTPSGERLRAEAASVLADCDRRFVASLPDTDVAHLRRILGTLIDGG